MTFSFQNPFSNPMDSMDSTCPTTYTKKNNPWRSISSSVQSRIRLATYDSRTEMLMIPPLIHQQVRTGHRMQLEKSDQTCNCKELWAKCDRMRTCDQNPHIANHSDIRLSSLRPVNSKQSEIIAKALK